MVRMILGIIHYVGGVFFVILFWGGLFFSRLSVGMMVVMIMMMNRKHICPHEMVFFLFFQLYISCAANRFFFPFSPTQEVIRVKIAMLALLLLL